MNLLPQTNTKKPALTEKQETFLDTLFSNGGDVHAAAEVAGYSQGSVGWLKDRLADEIIERTKTLLSSQALKAANKLVSLVDSPDIERQDTLFSNGGDVNAAAEVAGYSQGSVGWLKDRLADEIIERTKTLLSSQALKAANKLVSLVDSPDIERQDTLRMQAAESILNRVGLGKQETMNHNVQAVHGVVLLPPKKQDIEEVIIDG